MCVAVKGRARKEVVAWKMFGLVGEEIRGLSYAEETRYKVGELYKSTTGPGFQAFAKEDDARRAREVSWSFKKTAVYKVILYQAKKGVIKAMDSYSNDRPGWAAEQMKIVEVVVEGK